MILVLAVPITNYDLFTAASSTVERIQCSHVYKAAEGGRGVHKFNSGTSVFDINTIMIIIT